MADEGLSTPLVNEFKAFAAQAGALVPELKKGLQPDDALHEKVRKLAGEASSLLERLDAAWEFEMVALKRCGENIKCGVKATERVLWIGKLQKQLIQIRGHLQLYELLVKPAVTKRT